jgi:hypothetical protein
MRRKTKEAAWRCDGSAGALLRRRAQAALSLNLVGMDDVHGSGSPALAASRYLMQPPANNVETRCRSSAHLAIAVLTGDVATGSHGLAPIAPRAVRFAIGCLTFAGLGFIRLWWRRLRGLSPGSRVSSAVEQRFCKPLVGSSILSPGTTPSALTASRCGQPDEVPVALWPRYCTSRARRRVNSSSLIEPAFLSRSSLSISSAALKPTMRRSSSRACCDCCRLRSAIPLD